MNLGIVVLLMFGSAMIFMIAGLPLSFVLGGIATVFAVMLWGFRSLGVVAVSVFGTMNSYVLIAIPMFVFMANVLERSGVSDNLFQMMHQWFGQLRGGLAVGVVVICTVFAAMSGISGAAAVTMGVVALPAMLKRNYDVRLAMGSIMAGGALGVLIPPSIMMILYALMSGESVGQLFMGGILPGLLLSSLFSIYILIRCAIQPHLGPSLPPEEAAGWKEKLISLRAVVLPLIIVISVLGSIFMGMTTPTEAASIGAAGAIISAAVYRKLTWQMLKMAAYRTLLLSGMVLWIVFGAMAFAAVYSGVGAASYSREIVAGLRLNPWAILIVMQLSFFILGCLLDPGAIIMICTPVYVPVITFLGFNPLWFGIVFVVNMELSFLTPPFGYNLFYMRGVAPKEITMGDIYRSVAPFVILQAIGLALVMIFPQIALWLPSVMFD